MSSYRIYHNSDRFDCRGPHFPGITSAATTGGVLFWEREGMIGKVPNSILRDLLDLYRAYAILREWGRIVDLPPVAYELTWDQTVDHRPANESRE